MGTKSCDAVDRERVKKTKRVCDSSCSAGSKKRETNELRSAPSRISSSSRGQQAEPAPLLPSDNLTPLKPFIPPPVARAVS